MSLLEWVGPVCLGGGSIINVLLWADNWVHKRNTDSTTLSTGLKLLEKDVATLKNDVDTLKAGVNRLQFSLDAAEGLRVERALSLDTNLRRLEATVENNHKKATAQTADVNSMLSAWTEHVHGIERRTVSIETWINRTLTTVREPPADHPGKGGHSE